MQPHTQILWIIFGAVITTMVRYVIEESLSLLHEFFKQHPMYKLAYEARRKR